MKRKQLQLRTETTHRDVKVVSIYLKIPMSDFVELVMRHGVLVSAGLLRTRGSESALAFLKSHLAGAVRHQPVSGFWDRPRSSRRRDRYISSIDS